MIRTDKIQIACVIYLILSTLYTLFSYKSNLWCAFNYMLGYCFIAYIVNTFNPFGIINQLIACISIGRCIINVWFIWYPDVIFSKNVCIFLIISSSIFALWRMLSERLRQSQ